MSRMNKNIVLWVIASLISAATPTFATESIKRAFGLNIAASDTEPLRIALDGGFRSQKGQGSVPGPIESSWAWGTMRIRNIDYNFSTTIPELRLRDDGIAVTAKLSRFVGRVGRVELNKTGTRYCENIPVTSGNADVNVKVLLNAHIDSHGNFKLHVKSSTVDLDDRNFLVGAPANCNVVFGLNWLVKKILPRVTQSYRADIATNIGNLIASGLEETGIEYSPYLAMNITLPVNREPVRPFYAQLSVLPQNITINNSHFSAWFGSDIELDPDVVSDLGFVEPADWPQSKTHLAVSWDFLTGVLKEANAKGLISGELKRIDGLEDFFSPKMWDQVWDSFSQIPGIDGDMSYELHGADKIIWSLGDNPHLARLSVSKFRVDVKCKGVLMTKLMLDFTINVAVRVDEKDRSQFSALTDSVEIEQLKLDGASGWMAGRPWNPVGLTQISKTVEQMINASPETARRFINFKAPELHIGTHMIRIANAEFHEQGLLFPVRLEATQNLSAQK